MRSQARGVVVGGGVVGVGTLCPLAKKGWSDVVLFTPEQVEEIRPPCETDGVIGAIRHLEDGYIQPADLTRALAAGARANGAEIDRDTTVTAVSKTPSEESPQDPANERLRA